MSRGRYSAGSILRLRIHFKISQCLYPRFGGGIDILLAMLLPLPLDVFYDQNDVDAILEPLIGVDSVT